MKCIEVLFTVTKQQHSRNINDNAPALTAYCKSHRKHKQMSLT